MSELSEPRELNADELEVISGGWFMAVYGFASEVPDEKLTPWSDPARRSY